ncbi:hypothetical protein CEXT_635481 [Caerostris extrusa]|uniref:Uncharacterized protein n=1 Tax=Caerostris extrusa TaxID=172846 RepID=A0AAV4XPD0_CAEEX|nr:hypothetical protein CEXT_635481 [Caerostris extrusa]
MEDPNKSPCIEEEEDSHFADLIIRSQFIRGVKKRLSSRNTRTYSASFSAPFRMEGSGRTIRLGGSSPFYSRIRAPHFSLARFSSSAERRRWRKFVTHLLPTCTFMKVC